MADFLELEIKLKAAQAAGDAAKIKGLLAKIQDEQDKINTKAEQFSRRGFFGGQISEQIKKIADAFAIAGNNAATAEARSAALRGAWSMIGSSALGAAQQIYRFAHGVAESEARLADHETRVRRLGPAYNEMRAQTAGVITSEQALATQQAALNANLSLSADQLGRVARAAREHAATFGGDATASTQAFFQALQTGDRNVLTRFGVSLGLTGNRARDLDAAMAQLAANQARSPPMPPSATESLRAFDDEIERGRAGVTRWILEALSPGRDAMRLHREEVQRNAEAAQSQAREIAELASAHRSITTTYNDVARAARSAASAQREAAQAARTDRDSQLNSTFRRDAMAASAGMNEDAARSQHSDVAVARQAAQAAAAQRLTQRHTRAALMREVRTGHDDLGLPTMYSAADVAQATGGGGGGANALRDATRAATELRRNAAAAGMLDVVDPMIERRPGERAASWKRRLDLLAPGIQQAIQEEVASRAAARQAAQAQQQRDEAHTAAMAPLRAAENAAAEAQRATQARGRAIDRLSGEGQVVLDQRIRGGARLSDELIEETRRATNAGEQFNATFQRIFGEMQTAAQHASSLVGGAFSTMTGAFKSHLGAMIEGRETVGEAMRGIAHETLISLAQEAAVKAVMQTAEGLANLARWNFPGAAQNFAAAGAYGGVAVLAGIGAAATNPPAQTAAGGGGAANDRGPASTSARGAGAERGMGTVIQVNFNGAPIHTLEEVHDTVASAANIGRTRGAMLDVETLDRRRRAG